MTDLYSRILLWHKLVAMQTGGLALCSAKRKLNRDEATDWAVALENVAADIRQFLDDGTFLLDDRGQPVVQSSTAKLPQEKRHENVDPTANPISLSNPSGAVSRKVGGLRVATRKKT